jgi:phosphonopyruvate decarboxylase
MEVLAGFKGDGISVTTMRAIPDWYATGQAPEMHFDNRGCMGGAAPTALGIALAQPDRRVIIVDGDGSLLMQLGVLATIAGAAPKNFYHVVVVNGVYETSGFQPTPSAGNLDFAQMALGAGYKAGYNISDIGVLRERLPAIMSEEGPVMIALHVERATERREVPETRPRDQALYLREMLAAARP